MGKAVLRNKSLTIKCDKCHWSVQMQTKPRLDYSTHGICLSKLQSTEYPLLNLISCAAGGGDVEHGE